MIYRQTFLRGTIFLFILSSLIGFYSVNVSSSTSCQVKSDRQTVPMFLLSASEADVIADSFVGSIAIAPLSKGVYLSRQDTQNITLTDTQNKTTNNTKSFNSAKTFAVNSRGDMFVAGDSELAAYDAQGKLISRFSIPKSIVSLAALSNGEVAITATDSDKLLAVFDKSGNTIRTMGNLKQLDKENSIENSFLNTGKAAVSPSEDIYYVSMYSRIPTAQKFSKQGKLLKEFHIEGATVDLQLNGAEKFLQKKKTGSTGGFYVIRAAAVDPKTGDLWIGMNGLSEEKTIRAESAVLYEYSSEGDKLSEYVLNIPATGGKTQILIDIKEVAVNFPYVYVLNSGGKVFRFNLEKRISVTPKQEDTNR